MDDYTWRRKVRARESRRRQEKTYALALLFAVVSVALWYFIYYIHTPEYMLDRMQRAYNSNNLEQLETYVDLPKITGECYDDLTMDLFTYDDTISPSERALFENFYRLVRPQINEGVLQVIKTRFETNEWVMPDGVDLLKGRQLGVDFELLLQRSMIFSTKALELGEITTDDDGNTSVQLKILEQITETEFNLELALEKNDEGFWRIVGIKNYRAYLDEVSPKISKDVADYIEATRPIIDEFQYVFEDQRVNFWYLNESKDGTLTPAQKERVALFIESQVIPERLYRQEKLDEIPVPNGAKYFAKLRQQSTEVSIQAWRYYIRGLREESVAAFDTAESLQKLERTIDQRIEEIARRIAVARTLPTIQ